MFRLPVDAPGRHRQKTVVTDMCYPAQISSLMDFGTPDCSLGKGMERLSQIGGVAVVTAGDVGSDTCWWLKEAELWAREHDTSGGPCRSRVCEQSVNSSRLLIYRGQSSIRPGFDGSVTLLATHSFGIDISWQCFD